MNRVAVYGVQSGAELVARINYLHPGLLDDAVAGECRLGTVDQACRLIVQGCPNIALTDTLHSIEVESLCAGIYDAERGHQSTVVVVLRSLVNPHSIITVEVLWEKLQDIMWEAVSSGLWMIDSIRNGAGRLE